MYVLHHIAISMLHHIGEEHRIRRHLLHVDHPLDLRCHPLQFVCSPFEVRRKGELIGKVMVEMVAEVVVKMVREVVVHLSRHCHHYHPLRYLHPILPYFPILTHHPILLYSHTLTHHLPYSHGLTHLYHLWCRQC